MVIKEEDMGEGKIKNLGLTYTHSVQFSCSVVSDSL